MSTTASCRCGAAWTGLRACHCPACHQTLSCISAFDRHQRGGRCLHPGTVGLVQTAGIWRYPASTETVWPAQDQTTLTTSAEHPATNATFVEGDT